MPELSNELKDIGNPILMSPRIDTEHRMSNYIRASMMLVDLIPVDISLNLLNFQKDQEFLVDVDFSQQIQAFRERCASYGLSSQYSGVRLWSTDETVMQDEFSNQYNQNFLQSLIDRGAQLKQWMNTVRELGKSEENLRQGIHEILDALTKGAGKVLGEDVEKVIRLGTDIALEGKHISLPKIWASSDYNPSIVLNIKLVSPYGSPRAIKRFLIEPLTYILLLSTPVSNTGLTYGYPPTLYVKAYGIATLKGGYIEGLSIRRGGADLTYNQYRQPMMLNISLNIRPMIQGFAALQQGESHVSIDNVDIPEDGSLDVSGGQSLLINTVGDIINSFKPFQSGNPSRQTNLETSRRQSCVEPSVTNTETLNRQLSERHISDDRPRLLSYDESGDPVEFISDIVYNAIENDISSVVRTTHARTDSSVDNEDLDDYLRQLGRVV